MRRCNSKVVCLFCHTCASNKTKNPDKTPAIITITKTTKSKQLGLLQQLKALNSFLMLKICTFACIKSLSCWILRAHLLSFCGKQFGSELALGTLVNCTEIVVWLLLRFFALLLHCKRLVDSRRPKHSAALK